MRKKIIAVLLVLAVIYGSFYLGHGVVASPAIYLAALVGIIPAAACLWVVLRSKQDRPFLLRVFVAALLLRYIVGYLIYYKRLQQYLGADADTYDAFGYALLRSWQGLIDPNAPWLMRYTSVKTSGWGMFYYVASIYSVIGQNPLAIQFINCAFGAISAVIAYKITMLVYSQIRVARAVALMTAFAPSLVLWTSQGLKDGPILLCLCLCTYYALRLRVRFEVRGLALLIVSLSCLYTLRHYMAYILFVAIAGALILTEKKFTPMRALQGGALVLIMALALVYFGAGDVAMQTMDLEHVQRARVWGAKVANTGFGGDVDITDPQAAIGYLPIGVLYVLLAPFPWMMSNLRQLITLPELLAWWVMMPMLAKGFWFALRRRMKESFVISVFVVGLVLAFALYQSNAGTAYRHRAQLYVFFFIFINIGLELRRLARAKRRATVPYRGAPLPVATQPPGKLVRADAR